MSDFSGFTYAQTQEPGDDWFAAPDEYSLFLAIKGGRFVEVQPDSPNPTKFRVANIPATVQPWRVIQHVRTISMWPPLAVMTWAWVSALPRGAFVKTTA